MAKARPVTNLKLAYEAVSELLAAVCECGHLDSEHFTDRKLQAVNCAECACPKFKQAFHLQKIAAKKRR